MRITIHLRELLKKKHMSLTKLSELTGITIVNLSILKTGKAKAIRFSTLNKICKALDCEPGDIIYFE